MRKQKKEATTDYIAIIFIGGGSSWGRDPDKEKAIKYALQNYKDWRCHFDIKKGDKVKLNVIDAYPYKDISWDHSGFHADGEKRDFKIEHVERTVP